MYTRMLVCCLISAAAPAEPAAHAGIALDNFWTFFLVGAAGAASLEALRLYEYRGELNQAKMSALLSSPLFWSIVLGMLIASGFFAWALFSDSKGATVFQVAMAGAAMRSFIRQTTEGVVANQGAHLGTTTTVTLRDIF